jgi:hypothetical protein
MWVGSGWGVGLHSVGPPGFGTIQRRVHLTCPLGPTILLVLVLLVLSTSTGTSTVLLVLVCSIFSCVVRSFGES